MGIDLGDCWADELWAPVWADGVWEGQESSGGPSDTDDLTAGSELTKIHDLSISSATGGLL